MNDKERRTYGQKIYMIQGGREGRMNVDVEILSLLSSLLSLSSLLLLFLFINRYTRLISPLKREKPKQGI